MYLFHRYLQGASRQSDQCAEGLNIREQQRLAADNVIAYHVTSQTLVLPLLYLLKEVSAVEINPSATEAK